MKPKVLPMKSRVLALAASAAVAAILAATMAGCSTTPSTTSSQAASSAAQEEAASSASSQQAQDANGQPGAPAGGQDASQQGATKQGMGGEMQNALDVQPGQTTSDGFVANADGKKISETLVVADAFTERDLQQEPDTSSAQTLAVADGQDMTITEEGTYVISGSAKESTIVVEAADTAKVQLVLDGVTVENADFPAIYVKSADKVFVTLKGENSLTVTGEFSADGSTNTDAVIFSKDDLCLNGSGSLKISSSDNGITSKDDLKVTGGSYTIESQSDAIEANDSIYIADGSFQVTSQKDALHAENEDDDSLGYIYVKGGTFKLNATDDGLQGNAFVWIDGGTFDITAAECIEGTYIQINDGTFTLNASDDAINASIKSSTYTPTIEINGGTLSVQMGQGDTDALDSNGYLYIRGGKIDISAQSPFDVAWGAELTGGEVTANGQQVTEITTQMMGPGGMGQGGMGGRGQGGMGQGGMGPDDQGMGPNNGQTPPDGGFGTPPDGGPGGGRPGERPDGSFGGPPSNTGNGTSSSGTSNGTTSNGAGAGAGAGGATASTQQNVALAVAAQQARPHDKVPKSTMPASETMRA